MKIKRIYCRNAVIIVGKNNLHQSTLNNTDHELSYLPEMNGYVVDKVNFIPESNVMHVLLDVQEYPVFSITAPDNLTVIQEPTETLKLEMEIKKKSKKVV